jgi:hypothetical protein
MPVDTFFVVSMLFLLCAINQGEGKSLIEHRKCWSLPGGDIGRPDDVVTLQINDLFNFGNSFKQQLT